MSSGSPTSPTSLHSWPRWPRDRAGQPPSALGERLPHAARRLEHLGHRAPHLLRRRHARAGLRPDLRRASNADDVRRLATVARSRKRHGRPPYGEATGEGACASIPGTPRRRSRTSSAVGCVGALLPVDKRPQCSARGDGGRASLQSAVRRRQRHIHAGATSVEFLARYSRISTVELQASLRPDRRIAAR